MAIATKAQVEITNDPQNTTTKMLSSAKFTSFKNLYHYNKNLAISEQSLEKIK